MKRIAALLIAGLVLCVGMTTSFAGTCHSWRGYGAYRTSRTPVTCPYDDCEITGRHYHGTTLCYGHYIGDGHDHAWGPCNVEGCTNPGYHTHAGCTYCGYCTAGAADGTASSGTVNGGHHGWGHHGGHC